MDVPKHNSTVVDETPIVESDKETGVDTSIGKDKGKVKVDERIMKKNSMTAPTYSSKAKIEEKKEKLLKV